MSNVITKTDCGTDRGVSVRTDGMDAVGRFPAQTLGALSRNEAITRRDVDDLRKRGVLVVMVRSPLTCLVGAGTCARSPVASNLPAASRPSRAASRKRKRHRRLIPDTGLTEPGTTEVARKPRWN